MQACTNCGEQGHRGELCRRVRGMRYHKWTVEDIVPGIPRKVRCRCECGTVRDVFVQSIDNGRAAKSCGCDRRSLLDQRFGRLLVRSGPVMGPHKRPRWGCVCDCGAEKDVDEGALLSGGTQSCGCLHREVTAAQRRSQAKDLAGALFGHGAEVLRRAPVDGPPTWVCKCACGAEFVATSENILRGGTTQCPECARRARGARSAAAAPRYPYRGQQLTLAELSAISGLKIATLRGRLHRGLSAEEAVAEELHASRRLPPSPDPCGIIKKVFGRLTAVRYAGKQGPQHVYECDCSCGGKSRSTVQSLRTGATKSCGCYQRERAGEANRLRNIPLFGEMMSLTELAAVAKITVGGMRNRLRRRTPEQAAAIIGKASKLTAHSVQKR